MNDRLKTISKEERRRPISVSAIQLIEYSAVFGKEATEFDIREWISQIPRLLLINLVGVLSKSEKVTANKICEIFPHLCVYNRNIITIIHQIINNNPKKECLLYSQITCLEILRYAFATPFLTQNKNLLLDNVESELLFLKLILAINEKILKYSGEPAEWSIAQFSFLMSTLNPTVKSYDEQDKKNRIVFQIEMARLLFEMLTTKHEYLPLYNMFLRQHGIDNWENYILTILGVLCACKFQSGCIDKDLKCDMDKILSKNVLISISIPFDKDIMYSAKEKNDRESNSDYREFREKPIILLPNGNFFIFNIELLIDRLFNSLYYEFNTFQQTSNPRIDINQLFTKIFCQDLVFNHYIHKCTGQHCYRSCAESDYKGTKKKGIDPPDYMLLTNSSLLLFECKDIRINGEIIESHDLDKILQEYKNKLYKKDCGNNKYKNIGITQLVDHINSIREGSFPWLDVNKEIVIYPVLVLSDYKNVRMGLSALSSQWYETSLSERNLNQKNNTPLIVMSFITLFKYHHLFKEKGFEFFFDEYFKFKENENKEVADISNFDDFMSCYPDVLREFETAVNDIIHKKSSVNEHL